VVVVVVVPVAEHLGGVGPKAVAACAKRIPGEQRAIYEC
jgi:hypothetical protein